MSYLLRQARRSAWSGEETVTPERREQAFKSFERREEDTDGVSVFNVQNDNEVALVLAALACGKKEVGTLDLLKIEDAEVTLFGVVGADDPAHPATPVHRANVLHCVLDWTPTQLIGLVEHLLAARREVTRFTGPKVKIALLSLGDDDVEAGASREFLLKERERERLRQSGNAR